MLILQNPEYIGIIRIISGGQCGADFGGLLAAETCQVPTGGFAPKGFRTYFGPRPELGTRFNLEETVDFGYRTRTVKNVKSSDGTVIIASNLNSPGCTLTLQACRRANKPALQIQLNANANANVSELAETLTLWLKQHEILVLNVAGNRDKTGYFHEELTKIIIELALNTVNMK